jgi:hypothetical protein
VIQATLCPECSTQVAEGLLSCPVCHRLVHGERLRQLALDAAAATERNDLSRALEAWREALTLLPPASEQAKTISQKLSALSDRVSASTVSGSSPRPTTSRSARGALTAAAAVALIVWKFKFVAVFLLTKAKFLLFGLTKASTLFSMVLAASVYWTIWGWWFAVGVIASIYVHEMGHVAALRRYGIPASAPMFVPGLGAIVRMHSRPHTPREDARVGLAVRSGASARYWRRMGCICGQDTSCSAQWRSSPHGSTCSTSFLSGSSTAAVVLPRSLGRIAGSWPWSSV